MNYITEGLFLCDFENVQFLFSPNKYTHFAVVCIYNQI